jgi:Reverse transcriptase (RNA-dependent DNA polymerase)
LGLKHAPSIFQRYMDELIEGIDMDNVFVYLDDIIIANSDREDHHKDTQMVIDMLNRNKSKGFKKKCKWTIKNQISRTQNSTKLDIMHDENAQQN